MKAKSILKLGLVTASPSEFLVHYRKKRLLRASRGATAFCLPFIDCCLFIPGSAQQVEFRADQITAENQGIEVSGFAAWRVEDPLKACAIFDFSDPPSAIAEIGRVLQGVVESATRHQVASMKLEDVIRQRGSIIDALKREVAPVSGGWGIVLDTVEIRTVRIFSTQLFENLQAKYRDRARLEAAMSTLETERMINEQRCREEVLRLKAEMETRSAIEELAMRKARHEAKLAAVHEVSERGRIETGNIRDPRLTLIDSLPKIAAALPLHNIEIRADLVGDLLRAIADIASTSRAKSSTIRERSNE